MANHQQSPDVPHPATKKKTFIDILAEIDDWYTKELASSNPWDIQSEFLNTEQKARITRLAIFYGYKTGVLTVLSTPILFLIWHNLLIPFPEYHFGKWIGMILLGWPIIIFPFITILYMQKIVGTVTCHITKSLATWQMAISFKLTLAMVILLLYLPAIWSKISFQFERLGLIIPWDMIIALRHSYIWVAAVGLLTTTLPLIIQRFVTWKAMRDWEEKYEFLKPKIS